MSFSLIVNIRIKRVFKMLRFINKKTSNFKSNHALKILFFSLIKYHIEFGSIIQSLSHFP